MSVAIGEATLPGAPPRHRRDRVRAGQVVRNLAGLAVLFLLVRELGGEAVLAGLRAVTPTAVLAALVITVATTWCCARRWTLISARFGQPVAMRIAYPAYYRSQLLNATLPGGAVGDLHRGLRYGWRAVLSERAAGQVVQLVMIAAIVLPGPWRWVAVALLVLAIGGWAGDRVLDRVVGRAVGWGVGGGVGAVVVLSVLSTSGHLLVFLVCASTTGLPLSSTLSIGALVLLGASIPFNVLGWGPREGIAVWAFTLFGADAATGFSVAVTFGALCTVATLPGLLALGRSHE